MGNLSLKRKCKENWSIKILKRRPDLIDKVKDPAPYYKPADQRDKIDNIRLWNTVPERILYHLSIEVVDEIINIISDGIIKRAHESYKKMLANYDNLTFMEKAFFDSRKRNSYSLYFGNICSPIKKTIYKKYLVTDENDLNSGLVDNNGKIWITNESLSNPDKYFDKETAEKIKKLNLDEIFWAPIYGYLWDKELYDPEWAEGDFYKAKPIAEDEFLDAFDFDEEKFDKYYPNAKRIKEAFLEEENTEEVI